MLAIISGVSFTRLFVQRLVMSSETRVIWGCIGVSLSFLIKSILFSRLYLLGSGDSNTRIFSLCY